MLGLISASLCSSSVWELCLVGFQAVSFGRGKEQKNQNQSPACMRGAPLCMLEKRPVGREVPLKAVYPFRLIKELRLGLLLGLSPG